MTVPMSKDADLVQLGREVAQAHGWAEPVELTVADGMLTVHHDDADAAKTQAAVEAHTPAPKADPDAEFRAALEAATTVAQIRDALLGKTGPGAEPRRPDSR